MTTQKQNFMLRSTYEILQQKAKEIEKKLKTEMPKILRESYETGGYWHDNALWDEARKDQERLERELLKLLDWLREVTFIEDVYPFMDEDRVTIGKTVKVENVNTGEVLEYSIVGQLDVIYNPQSKEGKFISVKAPFVQPLLGKTKGERVLIELPSGKNTWLIKEIKPLSISDQRE